jgi:NADPH:quinone reductase-like Zn-dependent oxidoreductase
LLVYLNNNKYSGTGGVSITRLVLAKAAGAKTIITSSRDEKLKYVKEKWGVNHTINYNKNAHWAAETAKLTNSRGVDFIFENGGSGTIKQSIEAITVRDVIVVICFLAVAPRKES